ncbi:hypothetical protein F4804DRAFT_322664 [Jackrogersella minutella]|nr:hypothetical protein F4804DRAFT_322664 [Jackrogersella minutella]
MAGNQGAIHLNGPNGPQRPQGPVQQGGVGLGGRQAGPLPTSIHPPQGFHRAAPPIDATRGPSVEISDVSRNLKTIDDMREELTEYAIFRFEKIPVKNWYDDEGRLQVPTWDRAIRTRVTTMSLVEISRQIQDLNRTTRSLAGKLKSLSPVLQRQIDTAKEHLEMGNPEQMNYHWVLVQLDHQLKEFVYYVVVARGDHAVPRRRHSLNRRRPSLRTSRHERRSYQRISLIVYFKYTPRPNVDIARLYEARNPRHAHVVGPYPHQQNQDSHHQQQNHQRQNNHHQNRDQHRLPQPQPQPHPDPDLRTQQPSVRPIGSTPSGPNGNRVPQPVPSRPNGPEQGNGGTHVGIDPADNRSKPRVADRNHRNHKNHKNHKNHRNHRNHRYHDDPESDSDYSDSSSLDGSLNSQITAYTSRSSGSLRGDRTRMRDHGRHRVPTRNSGTGHNGDRHSRRSSKDKQYRQVKNGQRVSSSMPRPMPHMERVRDDAYLAGFRRAMDQVRMAQQRGCHEGRRSRPKPRIISSTRPPTPPYTRRMASSDPEGRRHRVDFDDEIRRFDTLSLDDEYNYDPGVPRQEDARRRREFEYHLQRGSVLEDDPFDRDRLSQPRHGSRRYHEPYVTDTSDSEYSLPRRSRR